MSKRTPRKTRPRKLVHHLITFQLHCGPASERDTCHKLFQTLKNRLVLLRLAYFARYGVPGDMKMVVSVSQESTRYTTRAVLKKTAEAAGREFLGVDYRVTVEPRGELSPLHDAIMAVALLPESKDPQQLADAFHWCLNAAGYNYADEIVITAGMAYNAGLQIHPNRNEAPLPYGIHRTSE